MVVKIINGMRIREPPYTRRRRMSSTGASAAAAGSCLVPFALVSGDAIEKLSQSFFTGKFGCFL
jgi:hypothetical protein